MRTWTLGADDPICLTLSADARFVNTDYVDDQSWELNWWDGDIAALVYQTSYGRRAQSMRIFPVFISDGVSRQDPGKFFRPPQVRTLLPNLAILDFEPFRDLSVTAEYYVHNSHTTGGRFTLQNQATTSRDVQLRLGGYLQPGNHPRPLGWQIIEGAGVLSGRTEDIEPVVMLSGGAENVSAAYPSLMVTVTLAPGGMKSWLWAHAGEKKQRQSYDACRQLFQISWDSNLARMLMEDANILSIKTGDGRWDAALLMAQKELLRTVVSPTAHSSQQGIVGRRMVDDGYARTNDGRDHTGPWGGLSTADTFFLAHQLLPIMPAAAKAVLRGILRTQNLEGELDWAPGLGGQRAGFQAMPMLSTLAWEIFRWTEDQVFLEEVFPALFSFFESWFSDHHDRDGDGFPEWSHSYQSGFDERPIFNRYASEFQGFDVSLAETIDLASYLFREGRSLVSIANLLGQAGLTGLIQRRLDRLKERAEASWSERGSTYHHVDRESHSAHPGLQLAKRRGPFRLELGRVLDTPARLLFRIKGDPEQAKKLKVDILSRGARNRQRTERLTKRKLLSFQEWSTYTSDKLNSAVDLISVSGIDQKLTSEVVIADLEREDLTLALPLWAGWMDQGRAKKLVSNTIMNGERYFRLNGLASIPATDRNYAQPEDGEPAAVQMGRNYLVGTGLVEMGFRNEAGALFQRLMQVAIETLQRDKAFASAYPPEGDRRIGKRGDALGAIPIGLFLAILGVRIITPTKIWVEPGQPFPWPVELAWRGLWLRCTAMEVQVRFPDGAEVTVKGKGLQCVEQLDVSTGNDQPSG